MGASLKVNQLMTKKLKNIKYSNIKLIKKSGSFMRDIVINSLVWHLLLLDTKRKKLMFWKNMKRLQDYLNFLQNVARNKNRN
jgi:hypothetical protein